MNFHHPLVAPRPQWLRCAVMALLRSRAPRSRRTGVVAACVALMLATLLAGPGASAEPPEDDPESPTESPMPERGCTRSGPPLRYLVLFPEGTGSRRVGREIAEACGSTTTYYQKIGVAVATSADPDFENALGPRRAFSAQGQRLVGDITTVDATDGPPPRPRLQPTDPSTVARADRSAEQWDMSMIKAEQARRAHPGKARVLVGVLDSGVDAAHPDLSDAMDSTRSVGCLSGKANRSPRAWAPSNSGHGTHVAGTIAASDDGAGITGVAPGVRLASIKVIGERGYVDPEAVVCGLVWAADHGMAVTNSSYFVDPASASCAARENFGVAREAIARAVDYAQERGTLNIAAATNEGVNLSPTPERALDRDEGCQALPASLRQVVAVSSVGADGLKAGYSSYGLGVITLTAPGGDARRCVLSTVPGGYTRMCGTSMAAPHVSGVAALIASAHPDLGPKELRSALTTSARATACPADYDLSDDGRQDAYCSGYRAFNGFYGHGLLDALAAVKGQEISDAPVLKSPQKELGKAPGTCPESQAGQCDKIEDVPDHGLLEHAHREATRQLHSVIQR